MKTNNAGLTLVEILIAITLIAIVGTLAFTNLTGYLNEGKIKTAKTKINEIESVLVDYQRQCGKFPPTLDALMNKQDDCPDYPEGGFVKKADFKMDPWNREFSYTSDGNDYEIKSLGADGKEGGDGVNKDISSK